MRVLVVSAPLTGHLLPMLPLGEALWEAGHDVLVATGGDAMNADTGNLPVIDVARGLSFARIAARNMAAHPLDARAELTGTAGTRMVARLFGAVNEELTDGMVTVVEQWRPDVVVHEPLAVAAGVAAARYDLPTVLLENSLFDGPALVRATAGSKLMRRALRRHGLDDERGLPAPQVVLTTAPRSVVGERTGLPMRPVQRGGGEIPAWLRVPSDAADRPRILVSRSTAPGPGADPMPAALAAAAEVDAEIVLVRPEPRVERRAHGMDRVRTVGWVPLVDVMPLCAAIVHHGGSGTAMGALSAGIPQLAVPGAGDRRHNAELIARRGAGLSGKVTAEALHRLVADGELAANAREVRTELEAMPPPEARVPDVAALD
ncbi:glycosyltransferase [Pseudonocardia sp. RS11V-5]|uniref:nucleotide disphospho-sugar-binding domain-containing protein n=1 Tax=Pseudonocardia terrae TaxID=2905831 RepID=UPI001E63D0D0|nr:nucleotide disphospho-sugar-binding domain-containing protein [Pseudonocardia terrae]MCE3550352.1 glycosyltransferase [Pseudonocardia terrae]